VRAAANNPPMKPTTVVRIIARMGIETTRIFGSFVLAPKVRADSLILPDRGRHIVVIGKLDSDAHSASEQDTRRTERQPDT
jgi:hypothetical protein